jgi:hypothetical protein
MDNNRLSSEDAAAVEGLMRMATQEGQLLLLPSDETAATAAALTTSLTVGGAEVGLLEPDWSERSMDEQLRYVSTATCASGHAAAAAAAAEAKPRPAGDIQPFNSAAGSVNSIVGSLPSIKVAIPGLAPPARSAEPDEPVCVARRADQVPRGKMPIRSSVSASLSMSPELVFVWRSVEYDD